MFNISAGYEGEEILGLFLTIKYKNSEVHDNFVDWDEKPISSVRIPYLFYFCIGHLLLLFPNQINTARDLTNKNKTINNNPDGNYQTHFTEGGKE